MTEQSFVPENISEVNVFRPAWWRHSEGAGTPDNIHIIPASLLEVLDKAADAYPSRCALFFQNYRLNYAQLRKKAEIFAASLRRLGVEHGDRVAIMLPNIPQTMIALWGVFKAGATAVMTNPLYMEKELTHHFADSGARFLITLDLLWPKIAPLQKDLNLECAIVTRIADGLAFPLNILQPWKARREGHSPEVPYNGSTVLSWKQVMASRERYAAVIEKPEEDLALLQYTGGTTGFAKGAMLTHANLTAQMQILQAVIGGDAGSRKDSFLGIMPFFHVFGLVGNIILPALYAAMVIPVPRYTPHDLLRTIQKYRPNFFVGAPAVYMSLMQQKDIASYDLTCIELCISGSAPFPQEAMRRFQEMTKARITEGFGLTEASPCALANPLYGLQKSGSIGVPIPATEARLVDMETGEQVIGDNEVGELVVRGPQVMLGYWNNPEETAQTLRDGWLFTGDLAYRDEDGYYFIVDRKKDMAIVGGYNVYPREIDEILYEHPKIADAVAVSVPHPSRGEVLKAYVVLKQGEQMTGAELTAYCRSRLANYKVPRSFEFRDELPKTLIGKVLRRALREEEVRRIEDGIIEEDILLPTPDMPALEGPLRDFFQELSVKAEDMRKKSEDLYRQIEDLMGETKEKMREAAEHLKDRGEQLRSSEMLEDLKEKAGTVREKTEDFRLHSEQRFVQWKEVASQKVQEMKEKAEELQHQSEGHLKEMREKSRGVRGDLKEKVGKMRQHSEGLLETTRERATNILKTVEAWKAKHSPSAPESAAQESSEKKQENGGNTPQQ